MSSSVFGFGVTQPETIFVSPGENRIVDFSVQNGAGAIEDVIVKLEVLSGKDIVELIEDNEYFVPAGGENFAKIRINIQSDAQPDDTWNVKLSFKTKPIGPLNTGMVSLGYGVNIGFDVAIARPVKEKTLSLWFIGEVDYNIIYGIAIVIMVAIIIYLLKGKKKLWKRKKRKKK